MSKAALEERWDKKETIKINCVCVTSRGFFPWVLIFIFIRLLDLHLVPLSTACTLTSARNQISHVSSVFFLVLFHYQKQGSLCMPYQSKFPRLNLHFMMFVLTHFEEPEPSFRYSQRHKLHLLVAGEACVMVLSPCIHGLF